MFRSKRKNLQQVQSDIDSSQHNNLLQLWVQGITVQLSPALPKTPASNTFMNFLMIQSLTRERIN